MRPGAVDSRQVRIASGVSISPLKSAEEKLIKEHKSYILDFLPGVAFTVICPQSQIVRFDDEIIPQLLSQDLDMDGKKELCEAAGAVFVAPQFKQELESLYKSVRKTGAELENVTTDTAFATLVNEQKELEASDSELELALQHRPSENINISNRASDIYEDIILAHNHRHFREVPEIGEINDKDQAEDLHNHYVSAVESLKLPVLTKIKCRNMVAKRWIPSFVLNLMFGRELVKAAKALRVLEVKYGLPSPLNTRNNLDEKVQIPGVSDRNKFKRLLEENAKHDKKDITGGASLSFNNNVRLDLEPSHVIELSDFDLDRMMNGEMVIRVTAKDKNTLIQVYVEPKEEKSSFYECFASSYADPVGRLKLRIPEDGNSVGAIAKGEAVYLSGREAVRYILKTCKNPS